MYRDGDELQFDTNQGSTDIAPEAGTPFLFGAWDQNSSTFDGIIDDVRIYRRALDPDEIRALYDAY